MRKQYNGDLWKLIPKRYGEVKDIGNYFDSEKRRLNKGERERLNEVLAAQRFATAFGEFYQEYIAGSFKSMGIKMLDNAMTLRMIRTNVDTYYTVVVNVQHSKITGPVSGVIEIRIPDKVYYLGVKVKSVKSEIITRLF